MTASTPEPATALGRSSATSTSQCSRSSTVTASSTETCTWPAAPVGGSTHAEWPETQHVGSPRGEERSIDLGTRQGEHHEALTRQPPKRVLDGLEARAVGPLYVVEDEQQASRLRTRPQL